MRIGMLAPPWFPIPPQAYGGIEAVVGTLAEALAGAGHEVLLAAPAESACAVTRLPGFEPSDPAELGMTVPELRHVIAAHRAFAEAGVDVIHDHTTLGPHLPFGRGGVPVVTTAHGPFEPAMKAIYSALDPSVSVVAVSSHQASTAGPVPVARTIHHGIDARSVPVGAGSGGYLVFLGRMSPTKGVRTAVEVARRAGMPLKIAAKMREPAERAYFESEVRPRLDRHTEFVGELTTAEKYRLLGDAVAMLNPIAWDEPFGMVMIEALACGTPVITTRRGSAPEIVEHDVTGYVCDTEDELVSAVARAGSIARTTCRRVTEEHFSAARMAGEYAELFARCRRWTTLPPDGVLAGA